MVCASEEAPWIGKMLQHLAGNDQLEGRFVQVFESLGIGHAKIFSPALGQPADRLSVVVDAQALARRTGDAVVKERAFGRSPFVHGPVGGADVEHTAAAAGSEHVVDTIHAGPEGWLEVAGGALIHGPSLRCVPHEGEAARASRPPSLPCTPVTSFASPLLPARAVMLAAGDGGRLGAHTLRLPKPLVPLNGRPLVDYTLEALAAASIEEVVVVTGYREPQVVAALVRSAPASLQLTFVSNPRYHGHASLSLRAARANCGDRPFILVMSDHLLSRPIIEVLAGDSSGAQAVVAADFSAREPTSPTPDPYRERQRPYPGQTSRHTSLYIEEATKLAVRPDGRVTAIGKTLPQWDALDAGAFLVRPEAWETILATPEDCELSVIFGAIAARGDLRAADISGAFWYDIDTGEDLTAAEGVVAAAFPRKD